MRSLTRAGRPARAACRRPGVVSPRASAWRTASLDLLWLRPGLQRVDDRALGARDRHPHDGPDLRRSGRALERVKAHAGPWSLTALGPRQRDVHNIRNHIGEVIELERTLVRDDRRSLPQ